MGIFQTLLLILMTEEEVLAGNRYYTLFLQACIELDRRDLQGWEIEEAEDGALYRMVVILSALKELVYEGDDFPSLTVIERLYRILGKLYQFT